jgi:ferritin-like metal-binding protein YciE
MKLDTLEQLYISELRDLYSAENQLLKALPKMAKGASSPELKDAFEKHLEQTKGHVERLEELFEQLDESPKGKTCHGMKGLIEEGSEILKEDGEDSVLDAGIIVAAQKVEHYEIASHGSVRTFANLLGKDEEAKLLQSTLDEESETNEILNRLAESIVNPEAVSETELAASFQQLRRISKSLRTTAKLHSADPLRMRKKRQKLISSPDQRLAAPRLTINSTLKNRTNKTTSYKPKETIMSKSVFGIATTQGQADWSPHSGDRGKALRGETEKGKLSDRSPYG